MTTKSEKKPGNEPDTKMPLTKTVNCATGSVYTIGRPRMKHRHMIAKVIKVLTNIYGSMQNSGVDESVAEVAKEMGITVEQLSKIELHDLSKEHREKLMKMNEDDVPIDQVAEIQNEAIFVCLQEAPFDWNPKTSTLEDLEENLDYGDSWELLRECTPFIVNSFPRGSDRKKL
ncbi:MAG: hypothetical protein KAJ19_11015 [Gammaproteobacteria bacterium]|nr:hypothetical protein [Gammaproteobacteria bacterium]